MASVKVTGITETITEQQLREFFSYSGEVLSVEIQKEEGRSAIVRFLDEGALETALLLTGATIVTGDPPVTVVALPAATPTAAANPFSTPALGELTAGQIGSAPVSDKPQVVQHAQLMVEKLVEKGYVLGADALQRAKEIDERAGISNKAKEFNDKLQITQRLRAGYEAADAVARPGLVATKDVVVSTTYAAVNKAKELNEKFQITDKSAQLVDKSKETANAAFTKAAAATKEFNDRFQVGETAKNATESAKNAVNTVMQSETVTSSISAARAGLKSSLSWANGKAGSLLASGKGAGSGAAGQQAPAPATKE